MSATIFSLILPSIHHPPSTQKHGIYTQARRTQTTKRGKTRKVMRLACKSSMKYSSKHRKLKFNINVKPTNTTLNLLETEDWKVKLLNERFIQL